MKEVYELMAVVKPLLVEDIKEKIMPRLQKEVKRLGGSLEIKDNMGKRLLAYAVDSYKEGYYIVYTLTMDSQKVTEFSKFMNFYDDVLKFLIVREDQL